MNKLLINYIKKNQGNSVEVIITLFRREISSEYTARELRRAIEKLIQNNQLICKCELKGKKLRENIYVPVYYLYGIETSITKMVSSKYNIHNLAYQAIRHRLHKGLTPEQALSLPPSPEQFRYREDLQKENKINLCIIK